MASPNSSTGTLLWDILAADEFDGERARAWTSDNWMWFAQVTTAYVVVIFGGRHVMSQRPPFLLQTPLALWNLALAAFSIAGAAFTLAEFASIVRNEGVQASYCRDGELMRGRTGWWVFVFVLSKVAEFGDTVFIVLRKKPLIFLHWYHHIVTLMYGVTVYPSGVAIIRWGTAINYAVHAIMYSYYFARAMNWRMPSPLARAITTIQIAQFVICVVGMSHLAYEMAIIENFECNIDSTNLFYGFAMYASYLVLFVRFFLNAYVWRRAKPAANNKIAKGVQFAELSEEPSEETNCGGSTEEVKKRSSTKTE